jgi:7,8-dihydropterin-6-yl-methyl-4-(beta-D-ribofuranosyl)aminobenzene 5'-phosphate synthase
VVETGGDTRIAARARVVGVLGGTIVEQALVLELGQEAAIVTGCAHPGIVEVVRRARRADPVGLIAGGFHLKDAGERDVANTTAALRELGVRRAAPSHCTGERAMRAFQQAFGSGFIPSGAGAVIQLPHVDLPPGGPP